MTKYLAPWNVDCQFVEKCNKRTWNTCMFCGNNKVAVQKKKEEMKSKSYFRPIRKGDLK